jgi:hypothetical protein
MNTGGQRSLVRMKSAYRVLCACIALSLSVSTATAETLADIGKAGFETCMKAFPDSKAIHSALEESGWRFEQSTGRFKFYSKNNRRVIAGTPTPSHPHAGCMVAVSKLTGQQAIALAKEIIKAVPGAKSVRPTDKDALAEWVATVNDVKVHIGAMNVGDFFFMRGAGLLMSTE